MTGRERKIKIKGAAVKLIIIILLLDCINRATEYSECAVILCGWVTFHHFYSIWAIMLDWYIFNPFHGLFPRY